ncbi:biotin--[acetyl-CoA-carboxylase] ligase [Pilimelia columellifera]|uniref:biotin--[biotin carboxyl-carrier protein] ligase n=1 Tax=Pilimelia columellifera subsp. columellifera TaxID=706583 RepID=A0ABN3NJC6_9ACTN
MSDAYSDLERPPLHGASLRRALLTPDGMWRQLDLRDSTGSTNADAADAARAGRPEGLIVVAEHQSAGRGRLDRAWESPPRAGLALSVLLRPGHADAQPATDRAWPPAPPAMFGWLPLLAGVALVDAITRVSPLEPMLKWPNDLLLDTATGPAKCAGILAEAVPAATADQAGAVIVGVGINVTVRAEELPAGVAATSLRLAGHPDADRAPLLRAYLRSFADWYGRWRAAAGDPEASGLREAYLRACSTIGSTVRVTLPAAGDLTGLAVGVDGDGRLLVATDDGITPVAAGDVTHVRPATD